jgi:hypothetical protein
MFIGPDDGADGRRPSRGCPAVIASPRNACPAGGPAVSDVNDRSCESNRGPIEFADGGKPGPETAEGSG